MTRSVPPAVSAPPAACPRPAATLRRTVLTLDAASLGPDSPLPPLLGESDINTGLSFGCAVNDLALRAGYGHVPDVLPYTLQDGYGRERTPTDTPVAVLENEHLRATFLLDYGGRLWSLVHKPTGRELLYRNQVLQPANLAVRNAWLAGGVEWNIGVIGHSPLTSSPVHAARVEGPDGVPVLRLYEWERIRRVPFQVDAWLPPGSEHLHVHMRISNPNPRMVPMYWWSNIAVPETPDVRVVAPADAAWEINYERKVSYVPVPVSSGTDRSYADRSPLAADYFYDLREADRPWIAALDGDGTGLLQTSTRRQRGRKLFFWGHSQGGRRWQEFLSGTGPGPRAYLEIQAGLADTQLEYQPMPPRTSWSWVETYGPVATDPEAVHGDWARARAAVAAAVRDVVPESHLEQQLAHAAEFADRAPVEQLGEGSGWGALERVRRATRPGRAPDPTGTPFAEDTLGEEQEPWLTLLRTGEFPVGDPAVPPRGLMVQSEWYDLLTASRTEGNWTALYHLGLMRWHAADRKGARAAWEASAAAAPNAWALRNLALLDRLEGTLDLAADRYLAAVALAPGERTLALEAGQALLAADRPVACRRVLEALPEEARGHGRVRLLRAQASLVLGRLADVQEEFEVGLEVEDLREGEPTLDRLWTDYHAKRLAEAGAEGDEEELRARARTEHPLPYAYDFRMTD
ncbi:DUF5107 domain-containing protein [Streptomyces sp. NPDC087440]|uniref:DUF5107 domain-containing protein n=1 Tax=Streptomyces sp. NPDC087440 TaxID=3365790 RepID=UPI0037F14706